MFCLASISGGLGCANVSSLQTARALKPGKSEVAVGGGYFTMPALEALLETAAEESMDPDSEGLPTSLPVPYLEVSYRRGLERNMDFGIKLTLIGTLSADFKYQLIDFNGFALATGAGLGAFVVSGDSTTDNSMMDNSMMGDSMDDSSNLTIIDAMIPIYASYDISRAFSLYVSPKYVFRNINGTPFHLGGLTGGTRIGQDMGVYLEVSYLQYLENFDIPEILQFNAAYYF